MNLISYELTKLVDDYYKCDNHNIREQILDDIHFLTEAVSLVFDQEYKQIRNWFNAIESFVSLIKKW